MALVASLWEAGKQPGPDTCWQEAVSNVAKWAMLQT